ncbi:MAG TPA: PAAR domain-containing protein [Kofleriaceae bacterium]|nr:PAAR domain-containing protein [Kofleriaceae bacterium]
MPGQGRLGDKSKVPVDVHGCPACPHSCQGPAILGSFDTLVNNRPALRVDDVGVHMACCALNMWTAMTGSATVFINNKKAHRKDDMDRHCGGIGNLVEGSDNVIVGG